MIMKDLIEPLFTGEEIDKEYGKQCRIEWNAGVEVQIFIINTLGLCAVLLSKWRDQCSRVSNKI